MNPQHNIPTMKDGDFCINESRVIATYLINKHAKDDKLYPKDTVTRAIVDHRYCSVDQNKFLNFIDILLQGYIKGVLTCATALERHWGINETLK